MLCDKLKNESVVSIACEKCGKQNPVPVGNVSPGIKCAYCGAELPFDAATVAARDTMLAFSANRADTKID